MATEDRRHALRAFLALAAGTAALPPWALAAGTSARLALAWDEPGTGPGAEPVRCIGVWALQEGRAEIHARQVVPTRAHGLARLPGGDLLAVARRPGLWMRRWSPDGRLLREAWAEPGRQFNGHVLASAQGGVLYSSEQRHEDGAGYIALRDPLTLALRDEWPTGGTDVHQMLLTGSTLFVANGGVPSRPETGRAKRGLQAMDSSLVAFDLSSGRRLGPWRLDDPRLSLRHLAWHASSGTLGMALQAEHDDPAERAAAPVLAVFDGQRLRVAPPPVDGLGYAGDIESTTEGFRLSATRAGRVLAWSAHGGWTRCAELADPCALAAGWAMGSSKGWAVGTPDLAWPAGCRPDNHAVWLAN